VKSRNMFMFQYYCFGMRISDCLLLRTTNFSDKGIKYRMKKTGSVQLIPPHLTISNTLKELFPEEFKTSIESIKLGDIPFNGNELRDFVMKMEKTGKSTSSLLLTDIEEFIRNFQGTDINLENHLNFLTSLYDQMGIRVSAKFFSLIGQKKENFIFPFLKIDDFPRMGVIEPIEFTQYQNERLHRRRVLYNKYLSLIVEEIGWDRKITGHTPRHSFSNTLHENEGTPEEISLTLGHKNLTTTIFYLKRFPSKVRLSGIKKFQKIHTKNLD
jgi:integrase